MKALILAGGYAKRMWPLTENQAKALLPVHGRPIIQYAVEKLQHIEELDTIYISTNERFREAFQLWMQRFQPAKFIKLVVEPTNKEDHKLGSVGAIDYFLEQEKVDENLLVLCGDNLFDFGFYHFLRFCRSKQTPVMGLFDVKDREAAKRFGVAEMDGEGRIRSIEEKPAEPKSTLISTGVYLLNKSSLPAIFRYLGQKQNPDAPGYFFRWLVSQEPVHGFTFTGKWFDIGSFQSYEQAQQEFK